jgi:uncharacterized protein (TIGR02996 family)
VNPADGFLEAILAEPDDDAHRLVYADWLDEHGDADRAEFIRLQVEAARLPVWSARRRELAGREGELLQAHEREWAAPVGGQVDRWRFRRGFVEKVTLSAVDFLRRGEQLFAAAPVRRINLHHVGALPDLVVHDAPAQRRLLALLNRVAELEVSTGDFNYRLAGSLARERFTLRFPYLLGDRLLALRDLQALPRLLALHLGRMPLTETAVEALVESPILESLTQLQTANGDLVPRLLHSGRLGRLTSLRLAHVRVGDRLVDALVRAPVLARLTSLSLGHNGLTEAGIRTLVGAPAVHRLKSLDLSFNNLGAAGVRALAESRHLGSLVNLNLSRTGLHDAGAIALTESDLFGRLHAADLSLNLIGDVGALALAGYRQSARLETLDLIYNHFAIDGEAGRALSERFGEHTCLFRR